MEIKKSTTGVPSFVRRESQDNGPISMTPREIVSELDRYIIGQKDAKRMVAIAMRNRWRRSQVAPDLRDEIAPKNIIMMGPTGVGKTEIARRLANLAGAPFFKVEATKFTEVGYVGRDVESMVRDLMEISINLVKKEESDRVHAKAEHHAEEQLLNLLLPGKGNASFSVPENGPAEAINKDETREKLRTMLRQGKTGRSHRRGGGLGPGRPTSGNDGHARHGRHGYADARHARASFFPKSRKVVP